MSKMKFLDCPLIGKGKPLIIYYSVQKKSVSADYLSAF